MKNIIFYFSSTGNSLYVAKKIREGLGDCELISIPKAMKNNEIKFQGDLIGFIFPLHSYGLPIIVREFLEKVEFNEQAYIFAVEVTGGGQSNLPILEMKDILRDKGDIKSSIIIKYISNYTRMGRNPTEKRAKDSINKNDEKLQDFIKSLKVRDIKPLPKRYSILHKTFYNIWKDSYGNKDKKFTVNNSCVGCAMCEKICPVDNIKLIDGQPKWNGICIDCMACINICPNKSINIGKGTEHKNRYRNPYIKASELL